MLLSDKLGDVMEDIKKKYCLTHSLNEPKELLNILLSKKDNFNSAKLIYVSQTEKSNKILCLYIAEEALRSFKAKERSSGLKIAGPEKAIKTAKKILGGKKIEKGEIARLKNEALSAALWASPTSPQNNNRITGEAATAASVAAGCLDENPWSAITTIQLGLDWGII